MSAPTEEWQLWTWREVTRALKVSRAWVYAKAQCGTLPSLRVGGLLRFDPEAVRRYATADDRHGTITTSPSPPIKGG